MTTHRIDEAIACRFVKFWPSRSRGAWVEVEDDGAVHIVFSARVGGGNMEDYQETWRDAYRHEWNVRCENDDFDSTYAYFTFKVPDDSIDSLAEVVPTLRKEAADANPS